MLGGIFWHAFCRTRILLLWLIERYRDGRLRRLGLGLTQPGRAAHVTAFGLTSRYVGARSGASRIISGRRAGGFLTGESDYSLPDCFLAWAFASDCWVFLGDSCTARLRAMIARKGSKAHCSGCCCGCGRCVRRRSMIASSIVTPELRVNELGLQNPAVVLVLSIPKCCRIRGGATASGQQRSLL